MPDLVNPVETGSPGSLAITGNYTQTGTGTLDIIPRRPFAGYDYNQLTISGDASLDGTLNLNWFQSPVPGQPNVIEIHYLPEDKIMTFGSSSGEFATINGVIVSPETYFGAKYDPNDVTLAPVPSVVVTSSTFTAVHGQPLTFTATVFSLFLFNGVPTGTVTFLDGTTVLGTATLDASGRATFTTSDLAVGNDTITMSYSGDGGYSPSTSNPLTQVVVQPTTTTTVSSSAPTSVSGRSVTFTATVTPAVSNKGTPTGTVNFYDGSTMLGTATLDANGQATWTTAELPVGSNSISAIYGGDDTFDDSFPADPLTQTVSQASTTTAGSSSLATSPRPRGQRQRPTAATRTSPPAGRRPSPERPPRR